MRTMIQVFGFPDGDEVLLFKDPAVKYYTVEKRFMGQTTVSCDIGSFNKALEIYADLATEINIQEDDDRMLH